MHHSEAFSQSQIFNADRWLNKATPNNERQKPLTRYLVPFNRGTRNCVGQNLAWTELYIGLGHVVRREDLELYENWEGDGGDGEGVFCTAASSGDKGGQGRCKIVVYAAKRCPISKCA